MSNENRPLEPNEPTVSESAADFFESTFSDVHLQDVNNEEDFKKIKQHSWKEHSEQYTELLTNYVRSSKKTLESKQCQKKWFFFKI